VAAVAQRDPELELIEDIASLELDPLGYVRYAFPWGEPGTELADEQPEDWQLEAWDTIGQALRQGAITTTEAIRMAVASGHGIGKSAFIAMTIKWALDTHEDTKVVITANTEGQLQTKTWPELAKWHRLSITSHWFVFTATSLYSTDKTHEKTWRADAISWSEHNTEAFAGLHNAGKRIVVLFDEASKIADKVWEVTQGALTDAETQILWLAFGNPTQATGMFRECFRRFKHRWITKQIDSRTVRRTNKAQIQQWVDDHGEESDFVKVRVRGLFPNTSAKQYIGDADVAAAYGRHLTTAQYDFAPVILTLDPAWSGDDELVIAKRQGLFFQILKTIPHNDNDVHIANLLANLEDEHKADAVFVDAGYGTGIVSAGRTMGRAWLLVWFAGASSDPGFLNKRAEMYGAAKQWLKEGGAIPPDPTLRDELTTVETVPRLDGKVQIESKKERKGRGLTSPNRADALILSFAFPVAPKSARFARNHAKARTDYDPIERAFA
jgi:hypothetical protein